MPEEPAAGPEHGVEDGADDGGTTVALVGTTTVDERLQDAFVAGLQRERITAPPTLGAALTIAVVVAVAVALGQDSVPIGLVGALVVLAILALLLRASTRTRVLRGYPEGTTIGVGVGEGTLRLDTGPLVEVLDLALVSSVAVRGETVLLRLGRGGTCLVPRALLGTDGLERVRAGIGHGGRGAAPPPAAGPLPWSHTVTAADSRARRTRLLAVVRRVRRSTYALVLSAALVLCGLTRSPWPLAIVFVIGIQDLLDRRAVARGDRLVFAEGTLVRAGIIGERLVVVTPQALLSRPLARLLAVDEEDGLVLLRWDLPSRETQYPAALLPAAAVRALREAAGSSDPPGDRPDN